MRWPICKREAGSEDSERCKLIDLDNWLSERYRVLTAVESREENGSGGPVNSGHGAGD